MRLQKYINERSVTTRDLEKFLTDFRKKHDAQFYMAGGCDDMADDIMNFIGKKGQYWTIYAKDNKDNYVYDHSVVKWKNKFWDVWGSHNENEITDVGWDNVKLVKGKNNYN